MKTIKILLTACGCPGAPALINALHSVDMKLVIVGTDMDTEASGRFLCDYFYTVPRATAPTYMAEMLDVVNQERPFLVFPENGMEAQVLSEHVEEFGVLNAQVLLSPAEAVAICNNKWKTFQHLKTTTDLMFPKQYLVKTLPKFLWALAELGYPDKAVVFKPPVGSGSRGLRIIDSTVDPKKLLLEMKPNSRYITRDQFVSIFSVGSFPELIVQEYIDGPEECAECLCHDGKLLLATVRTREDDRSGLSWRGELVRRPELVSYAETVIKRLELSWCVSLQFMGGKLTEINPRISTQIYQDDLVQAYLAIQLALGLITEEDIRAKSELIQYGLRFKRLVDQVQFQKNEPVEAKWTDTWNTGTSMPPVEPTE